ncbi:hypothetical protein MLD38_039360 [Melastoma candidum]|uniref:Uncharacterized protein n=1 Tax=Melastoma candidum TaxID=119954 RepID=A0ACB9L2K8_9MYRT|nr:hypothetical protein MLD38_039360 [Melastoma candidum]
MADMGGPCETCGVMGWDQFILTCEKCSTREHQYCTKILLMEPPCSWICEQCDLKMKQIPLTPLQQKDPPAVKEVEDNKRGKETRSLNTVKEKKVKYLPLEDVLKMPLGERGGSQFQSRRKDIPLMRQANKAKPHLQAKVRVGDTKVTMEKPPKMNPAVVDEVPTFQKREKKIQMPSASTISHAIGGLPGSNLSKVATNKDDLEKKDALSDAITRADIYRPHFPSAWVTWTGRFKFPEDSPANSYGDITFYAVSPGKVSRKASELSLSLPSDLLVELIPLSQLVVNLFPNSDPDLRDVGIYFAAEDASESGRSFRTYKNLVECLLSKEIALRCCLDGAELFIFTSKILNSDSQLLVTSGLKNKYFLWGVYRCTSRGDRSSSKKSLFSESACQKDENENSVCPDISSRDLEVEGLFGKEMAPSSMASVAGMENESCGIPGPSERIKVEVQPISPAIPGPRPKPQASVLTSESPANLKNWVTLDTSSAVRSEKGTAGAGGIISTSSGKWEYGFVFNLGRCNKRRADLWSLLQGLMLLWGQGYRAVRVRTDSESAMGLLKTAPSPEDPNGQLIIGCRDFLVRDWKCILSHIKVEENQLAHQLAEQFEGYSLGPTFLEAPPAELSELFQGKGLLMDCILR